MDKFDEKFPCKCIVCGNSGVNCQGECKCSYEVSTEIIEKPTEIKSFIESSIREVLKEIVPEITNHFMTVDEYYKIINSNIKKVL